MNQPATPALLDVVAGILVDEGRILVGQRAPHVRHAGKWEFPGGKVEAGESLAEALRRELFEELAIDARIGEEIWRTTIVIDRRPRLRLVFFRVPDFDGTLVNQVFAAVRWVSPAALRRLDLLDADREFVARVGRGDIAIDGLAAARS